MTLPFKHKGPRVLLTEGKNDCHLISSLCNYHNVPQNFGLHECGSDSLVIKKLAALIASSEPMEVIGVVLDADNPGIQGKWQALRQRLEPEGYVIPGQPDHNGTILRSEGKPVIGIWLMPDNNLDGMLEDFCKQLAHPDAIEFAESCVMQAREGGFSSFTETHCAKAAIHTYLAWQDEPGMPMGMAVTARALDPEQPIAHRFNDFLRALF
jgi:hypothetical protein